MSLPTKRIRKKSVVTEKSQADALALKQDHDKMMEDHRARMAQMRENAVSEAERIFTEELTKSAEKIIKLRDEEQEVEIMEDRVVFMKDPRFSKIQFEAAKFNLECFGFRGREANTQPVVNINITQNQVEKIERYAKMSEGFSGG